MVGMRRSNPVAIRRVALLFEPVVKSGIALYSYFGYLLLRLCVARFDVYKIARESVVVVLLDVDRSDRGVVYTLFSVQWLLITVLALLFINNYMSRGGTLPRSLVKNTNLKGKVALVTGGYSGIGYETALQLLKWRCKVVICGRNKTKATNAIERLKTTVPFDESDLSFIEMDLDNLVSVKNAAAKFLKENDRLDFLINNAGIWASRFETTVSGLESQFSSNFLGHFYLTKLLVDMVKKSDGRILSVSSIAHFKYDPNTDPIFERKSTTLLQERKYNTYYGRSKLYTIWFTNALQRRLKFENKKVLCLSLAPGVINTPLLWPLKNPQFYLVPKYLNRLVVKRPVDGAATTLFLCAMPTDKLVPAGYYNERKLSFVSKYAHDYEREEKLYKFAEELVEELVK